MDKANVIKNVHIRRCLFFRGVTHTRWDLSPFTCFFSLSVTHYSVPWATVAWKPSVGLSLKAINKCPFQTLIEALLLDSNSCQIISIFLSTGLWQLEIFPDGYVWVSTPGLMIYTANVVVTTVNPPCYKRDVNVLFNNWMISMILSLIILLIYISHVRFSFVMTTDSPMFMML